MILPRLVVGVAGGEAEGGGAHRVAEQLTLLTVKFQLLGHPSVAQERRDGKEEERGVEWGDLGFTHWTRHACREYVWGESSD